MIKRCILISLGNVMIIAAVFAASLAASWGNEMPASFSWKVFGRSLLISSPFIAAGIALVCYNSHSLIIDNAVENKKNRTGRMLLQLLLVVLFSSILPLMFLLVIK